jgi:DNA-binding response OmpR family regulator
MKRILIVEDEEGMLDGLAHNFRYEGYDVLTAKNGQEGLRMALKQKPDAVLLDIMLPEKDGFTVLKELRQRHKEIPVLVMTARNFEADVLKGFDLGADDYVTKPFSIKEVMARVKRLVARRPRPRTRSGTSRCASSRARCTRPPRPWRCRSRSSSS